MSGRREPLRRGNTYDFTNRRDGERSPRGRDRERNRERDADSYFLDRGRELDRDDRDRYANAGRYRERSPRTRSMGSSPPTTTRIRENRPPGPTGAAAANASAATMGTGNGDQHINPTGPVDKQLSDSMYAAYSYLAKHAQLRNVFLEAEREVQKVTAERTELANARFDDYPSAREMLQRRQDAADGRLKKAKSDVDASRSSIGRRAHEFVTILLTFIASQSKSHDPSPRQDPNVPSKSDLQALERRLEEKLATYEKRCSDQDAVIAKQADQISALQTISDNKGELISQQGEALAALQSDTLRANADLQVLQTRVQAVEAGLSGIRSEVYNLRADAEFVKEKTVATHVRTEDLSNSHANMKDTLEKLQASHEARAGNAFPNVSEKVTALEERVQRIAELQERGPPEGTKSTADLHAKLQDLDDAVRTIKGVIEQRGDATRMSRSIDAPPTAVASGEDLAKIVADLKRLQVDQEQKMDRKVADDKINEVRLVFTKTFNGLVSQFGGLIDQHDERLRVIEAAAPLPEKASTVDADDKPSGSGGDQPVSATGPAAAESAPVPEVAPQAEGEAEEDAAKLWPDSTAAKLKEELDTLKERLEATRQDLARCHDFVAGLGTAIGTLRQRHDQSQDLSAKFQQHTTDLMDVLQHAVHNLSSQFNNLSTEDLCKKILRHVSVLSGQRTAEDLTRRMDSLERAWQTQHVGGVNGPDPGSSKKRKTSAQTPSASGPGR